MEFCEISTGIHGDTVAFHGDLLILARIVGISEWNNKWKAILSDPWEYIPSTISGYGHLHY